MSHHLGAHFLRGDLWHPAEFLFGFGRVSQQGFDFSGSKVAGVDADDGFLSTVSHLVDALAFPAQLHAQLYGRPLDELAHAVLHAGGDDEVIGLILLQHHPLHTHVVFGVAPVAQGVNVAHVQAVLQAQADVGQAPGDFAGDEGFATARAFVVEQDAVAGIHAVGFAVVDGDPVGVELGHGVGAARVEGCGFFLRGFLHQAVEFAGRGLVEAGFLLQAQDANGFQNAQRAHAVYVGGVFGAFKAHSHMGLSAEVIDFVWLRFLDDAGQVAAVAQVPVVQLEACVVYVRVLVDVVYALGVE